MLKPHYPHKAIASLSSLSLALGLTIKELTDLSENSDKYFFLNKVIDKPDGSKRETYDARPELKSIHERIKQQLLKRVVYPSYLHGSLKGKDYISNIKEHTNKKIIISEDASNFFPSISAKVIHQTWSGLFGFSNEVASCLTELVTHKGFLVQGAKPSSYLCNLVLWKRESKLVNQLNLEGYTYTRFVDDITISSDKNISKSEIANVIQRVYQMLQTINVKPNIKKHAVMLSGSRQQVHGINLNSGRPTMPKTERDRIKSAVYECENYHKHSSVTLEYCHLFNQTMGRVNNMKRMHPDEGLKLRDRLSKIKPR
ncbi:MAG: reverse transcriptase family protein [Colwellia sp.]